MELFGVSLSYEILHGRYPSTVTLHLVLVHYYEIELTIHSIYVFLLKIIRGAVLVN